MYGGLLGFIVLSFVSALTTVVQSEKTALQDATPRAEADRLYELCASDLAQASLATVSSPAPGATAATAVFRRVTAIAVDGVTGRPFPVVEPDEVTFNQDATGLTRIQSGRAVLLSPCVTELAVERIGTSRAFRLRVVVSIPGAAERAGAPPITRNATAEGQVLIHNE